MFLPKNHFKEGAGFSNLEYGLMAELLGKSHLASEVGGSGLLGISMGKDIVDIDWGYFFRLRITPLRILETWRFSPSTETMRRRRNGLTRCWTERFDLLS